MDGKTYNHCYGDDKLNIFVGLSTDGFLLFDRSRVDCWPIILINYSLPPEIRTRKENLICIGLVPGESHYASFQLSLTVQEAIDLREYGRVKRFVACDYELMTKKILLFVE